MKIFVQDSPFEALRPLKPHLVLVCTDNGTPCAVISNLGDNVALRTAAHADFGDTPRFSA